MPHHIDRIMKENFDPLVVGLMRVVAKLEIGRVEDIVQHNPEPTTPRKGRKPKKSATTHETLKDKIQVTLEREADFLKKVLNDRNPEGNYILHLEFQATNDPEMLGRMYLYHALLYHKFGIRIRQFIIYVGDEQITMPNRLELDDIAYTYPIIDLRTYDATEFLNADTPEEVLLAILCNFGKDKPEAVVRKILERIDAIVGRNTITSGKYARQLEVLSRLRKLQFVTKQQINDMSIQIDWTNDVRYDEFVAIGRKETLTENIRRILEKRRFSIEEIADMLGISEDFVREVQANMESQK